MHKILVVDDNTELLAFYAKALSSSNYTLTLLSNPQEAKRFLETNHVDILISDIIMPKVTGFSLIRFARKINPDIKVVAISGGHEGIDGKDVDLYLRTADNLPVSVSLKKPVSAATLQKTIQKVCRSPQSA